jgi:sigma-B regulation protein RsbU (phosphoserine phosphatase)
MNNGPIVEVRGPGGAQPKRQDVTDHLLIGRSATSGIWLDSEQVSRRHAEFWKDPTGQWWIRDLQSRNGTRVNGQPIALRQLLPGDLIQIGEYSIRFLKTDANASISRTQSTNLLPVADVSTSFLKSLRDLPPPVVQAAHLSRLTHFARELAQTPEPVDRMSLMCKLMTSGGFPSTFALVLRIDKDLSDAPPEILSQSPASIPAAAGRLHISRTMVQYIREHEQAVVASNVGSGTADVKLSMASDEMASTAIACPLSNGKTEIEVLYLMMPPACGTAEWLAIASLACEQYQQSEADWTRRQQLAEYAGIQRDLEQARDLQRRLLPQSVTIPGWDWAVRFESCHWVGGDYVDVIAIADGKFALVIADVCGHGLNAAFLASSLHAVLSATLIAADLLDKSLNDLNNYLCRVLPEDRFVTLICVVIDPRSGSCRSVNAGHPPAFVVGTNGEYRTLHSGEYAPLGIFPDLQIAGETDQLNAGELLGMYTDGLIEIPAADGQLLGHRRLGEHFASIRASGVALASQAADQLFGFVNQLQGDDLAHDDRALLVAGWA